MTKRSLLVGALLAIIIAAAVAGPVTGADANEPSPPVTVERTFVGTSSDSQHAVAVTVTIAPTEQTGAINNTVVTTRSEEAAFIAPSSISTSETTGGNQVITQRRTRPAMFDLERLEPGESASISFRVYPKAVFPSGETLATVAIETQFMQTKRVVSETTAIEPTVNASQASYTVEPPVSPLVSAGGGAVFATLVTVSAAFLYRRRRRQTLRGILQSAKEQSASMGTEQAIDKALNRLGGSTTTTDEISTTTDEPDNESPTFDFDD